MNACLSACGLLLSLSSLHNNDLLILGPYVCSVVRRLQWFHVYLSPPGRDVTLTLLSNADTCIQAQMASIHLARHDENTRMHYLDLICRP